MVIRSNDSDVVVLAIANFVALEGSLDELWIAFGARRHFKYSRHLFK